jgi:hypothetical protein
VNGRTPGNQSKGKNGQGTRASDCRREFVVHRTKNES